MPRRVERVELALDGASHVFQCKDVEPTNMHWSGEAAGLRLRISGRSEGLDHAHEGPWGFLRFIGSADVLATVGTERIDVDVSAPTLGVVVVSFTPLAKGGAGAVVAALRRPDAIPPEHLFAGRPVCEALGGPPR